MERALRLGLGNHDDRGDDDVDVQHLRRGHFTTAYAIAMNITDNEHCLVDDKGSPPLRKVQFF